MREDQQEGGGAENDYAECRQAASGFHSWRALTIFVESRGPEPELRGSI